jgi:dienelactone hydrolase
MLRLVTLPSLQTFWRIEPGIQLSDQNEQDWARAFQLYQGFDEVKGNDLVSVYVYPKVNHAFARIGGQHYHQESAELANSRTKAFLQQHLGA